MKTRLRVAAAVGLAAAGCWLIHVQAAEAGKPAPGTLQSAEFWYSPRILKDPAGERLQLGAVVQSGGLTQVAIEVAVAGQGVATQQVAEVKAGKEWIETPLPAGRGADVRVDVRLRWDGGERLFEGVSLRPPQRWTIHLSQHTHTDIGYTRPQTEILPESLRFIDYALDFCDLTDALPDDARFRWTCETFWAVREFLKSRPPEQVARLKQRVQEGRVEIAGLMLNLSEIATESSLTASLQPLRQIRETLGPVRMAMQNDVNGAAWCLPDLYEGVGVKYLTMGINQTRSILPFDKPTPFWWESPSGNRILAYRAEHYMLGNFWGLEAADASKFSREMALYLRSLEDRHYAYDRVAVQFSGYFTDNSPPSMVASDFVRQWNEKHASPRLRLSTAGEFLAWVEEAHGRDLPVHRQAWPDWWTDGFGSAARETAASRETHSVQQVNDALLAMASLLGRSIPDSLQRRAAAVQENLMFYDEHTYGAAESISDPAAENSQVQWGEKSAYAWTAVKEAAQLREEAFGLVQDFLPRGDRPVIAVVNTLNWPRSGLVKLFIDHEMVPPDRALKVVDLVSGQPVPVQALSRRSEGTYWMLHCDTVPPLGYRMLRIEATKDARSPDAGAGAVANLETAHYRLALDPAKGGVVSLIDKQSGRECVAAGEPWAFGQLIQETLTEGRDFDTNKFRRVPWRGVKVEPGVSGPLWKSMVVTGMLDGCDTNHAPRLEIRLYETEKRVEFLYAVRKLAVPTAEAVYVAFPFKGEGAGLAYEAQGGLVVPGRGQLPGSASDWQTVQNFVSVRDAAGQVVWGSEQVPLVQLGDINLGRWQRETQVPRPTVFSWVMNNYWFTNFRVSQDGEFRWSYYLTSMSDPGAEAATRFGWGSRVPLVARVLPELHGKVLERPASGSVLKVDAPGVVVVDARPAGPRAAWLHLREVAGKPTVLNGSNVQAFGGLKGADEINVLGEVIRSDVTALELEPFGVRFLQIRTRAEP